MAPGLVCRRMKAKPSFQLAYCGEEDGDRKEDGTLTCEELGTSTR